MKQWKNIKTYDSYIAGRIKEKREKTIENINFNDLRERFLFFVVKFGRNVT